jgi:HK97 family phage prohead protease
MDKKIIKYISKTPEKVEDRVLRFIGSTEAVDRDQEILRLKGWNLKAYKKNPVVLVAHNPMDLPVARTKKVWKDQEKKALMFDVEFPEPDVNPQSDTLYKLYKSGFMKSVSVGFRPDYDKIKYIDGEKDQKIREFNGQELLELSLVSIPANPEAVITQKKAFKEAVEKEVIDELELNDLELWLKESGFDLEVEDSGGIDGKKEDPEPEPEQEPEKEVKDINNIKEPVCTKCGIELVCLCDSCREKKELDDYYTEIYNDIMFSRQEDSDN